MGASPGGWTSYLAEVLPRDSREIAERTPRVTGRAAEPSAARLQAGIGSVVAIDPGALEPRVLALPAVEHLRTRFEEALPRLLERSRTSGPYDLYCCDMNAPPAVATDLLLQALPLLRAGAVVVLTFKNTFKKPAPWHEACEAALARLRGPLDGVRSVQLFANTVRECTVLGEVRAAVEAGAAERCRAMQSGRAMLLRRILADYFAEHAPDGSHKVENLVARVVGGPPTALDGVGVVGGVLWDEAELFSRLEAKYGAKVDPDP